MTEDIFNWLLGRVFGEMGQAIQNIQSQMLLPPEWNVADCAIRTVPKEAFCWEPGLGGRAAC
jgi:hypothetical protein